MSDEAAALPPDPPDPTPGRPAATLTRLGRLLRLVRGLMDHGLALIATLRRRPAHPDGDRPPASIAVRFGTLNVALIIARITRGLRLATVLEARLRRFAVRLDSPPPVRTVTPRDPDRPRATRVLVRRLSPKEDDADLFAALPTEADAAIRARGRSIGDLLADIGCDLGVIAGDDLWAELRNAVIGNGASFERVVHAMLDHKCYPRVILAYAAQRSPTLITLDPPLVPATGPP